MTMAMVTNRRAVLVQFVLHGLVGDGHLGDGDQVAFGRDDDGGTIRPEPLGSMPEPPAAVLT